MSKIDTFSARSAIFFAGVTFLLAIACRLLEWPMWENPEFKYDNEMLLATHDAYYWVAGATGFGAAVNHPMAFILRDVSSMLGQLPANVAFWSPAVLASLVATMTCLWALCLGARQTAIAAGLIAVISPGFLGRTLLGFYDTDLVTLFFPLLIALPPALWCTEFIYTPPQMWRKFRKKKQSLDTEEEAGKSGGAASYLTVGWFIIMALSGLLAWYSQQWHSVFPYLVRYDALLFLMLVLVLGKGEKNRLLIPLAWAFPCACGPGGLLFVPAILLLQHYSKSRKYLSCLWLLGPCIVVILAFLSQGEILDTLLYQINAYLKHTGDSHASGQASLIFPSVAQSIIEVQDLDLAAIFPYFHPLAEAAMVGFACFFLLLFWRPAALFLLPLAVLGILSSHLGGRMVMFGAPIVALGLAVPWSYLISKLLGHWLPLTPCGYVSCLLLMAFLVLPFLNMIPALSQGPILNRRHAAALSQAEVITPADATLWVWWDWGYAAQYFAHRNTIADGARHGGPSLYLPAAVFATENARFARQIIRQASIGDNEPGNFFRDLNPDGAQALLDQLRSPQTPLVQGVGRQFIIVSFEMLKLGFWISNFGNWNFITCRGEGGALSIVPQAVAFRLNAGEVRLEGQNGIIFPASINVFAESGLQVRNYIREWFRSHPDASMTEQKKFLATRRNVNFLFNQVTDEKLVMDEGIYNSLMVQLLLCDAHDPRFAPYFRLVYDNVFARIYEVLP